MIKSSKKYPSVSFVIAIYNSDRTIGRCLSSILSQDYPKENYEIIVVDGGSIDDTLKIVSSFAKGNKNISILKNPYKLSEGKGMGKDQGVKASKGEIIVFLDGDNILTGKDWTTNLLLPFEEKEIMASQSMLSYNKGDSVFLKYINAIGIDDPFAIPYSLVSQITFRPYAFQLINGKYYRYVLNKKKVLYAGANGCAFRKSIFPIIGGYTREVDVFATMAEHYMTVAVSKDAKVFHDTTSTLSNYMLKKAKYFRGFFKSGYKYRKFNWVENGFSGKLRFLLYVAGNLSILYPLYIAIKQFTRSGKYFWFLHPLYLFYITMEYILLGTLKFTNFINYISK